MKRCVRYVLLFLGIIIPSLYSFPQNKKDLEKKKDQLKKDIEYTNQLLEQTKQNKMVSLNQLVTLNKKISLHEELIGAISNEMNDLDVQIARTNSLISALEIDMKQLKDEYAKMIYFAYKNQNSYSRLMFIFASKDFNEAYKRVKYLQQYTDYRKQQKDMIVATQNALLAKRKEMLDKKVEKGSLLNNSQVEKSTLDQEKTEQVSTLNSLQDQEKKLKVDLKEKQRAADKLNAAIEDLIRNEITSARKKSDVAGVKNPENPTAFNMTPEVQKLSNDFSSNIGKLPWPVEQGVITETFGTHPHPILKGIMIKNDGIEISCQKGMDARCVFDGEVSGVIVIPGANKAVIIRHGEYLSVYSNLEDTYIKMGDKVSTKQKIGLIHTNDEDSKTELNFQIWKGTVKLDPSSWLFRK
jgi:septal ring factor EnvC (AmiA/AmiB activator)